MEIKCSKTYKNLLKTFAGECRARTRYNLFGEQADKEGCLWVKEVFDETANNEYAHAREAYKKYLCLVGDTKDNLLTAMKIEKDEFTNIYKEFEEDAKKEGFDDIAHFYKELQEVEEIHYKRLEKLYEKCKDKELYKSHDDVLWECMNCGYIHKGEEAPCKCPLCGYPQKYFKNRCEESKGCD